MASHSDAPRVLLLEREVEVRHQIARLPRAVGLEIGRCAQSAHARFPARRSCPGRRRFLGRRRFALAAWIRKGCPDVKVLVASTFARAAQQAGDLCGDGPLARKPDDPQVLLRQIRRLLGSAERDGQPG